MGPGLPGVPSVTGQTPGLWLRRPGATAGRSKICLEVAYDAGMQTAFQGSLLDLPEETGPGPLGASVRRTVLAHGAWVDVRPGWVRGADGLFERLARVVPWRAERRRMYDRVV